MSTTESEVATTEKEKQTADFLRRRQDVAFFIILLLVATAQFWVLALRDLIVNNFPSIKHDVLFLVVAIVLTIILFVVTQYIFKIPLITLM